MENKQNDRLGFKRSSGSSAVRNMLLGTNGDTKKTDEIVLLPIDLVDPLTAFKHPFEKSLNKGISELAEKIRLSGVLVPAIVRQTDERYEVLAGHRRRSASIMAGQTFLPAIIRNCDDDTAKIIVTDTNLGQRDEILPSEKAAAYQMQMEALKHQGKRNDLISEVEKERNLLHNVQQVKTIERVAEMNEMSARQVAYYLRINELIEPLLDMVDNKEIPFRVAVDLSYLSKQEQLWIYEILYEEHLQLTIKAAVDLKSAAKDGVFVSKMMIEAFLIPDRGAELIRGAKPTYKPVLKSVEGYFKRLPPERAEKLELIEKAELEEVIRVAIDKYLDGI